MVSFENTEIAFRSKTNRDLRRSYWLFKLIAQPSFVAIGKRLVALALRIKFPITTIVKKTIFKQFCGGENIDECAKVVEELHRYAVGTILDYSVEGKDSELDFEGVKQEILETIQLAKGNPKISFCVFKLSGIASHDVLSEVSRMETINWTCENRFQIVRDRVHEICNSAFYADISIFIDAEESWIQPAIDNLANEMMGLFNIKKAIVYNTFQLYRKDRLVYLETCIKEAKQKRYFLGAKLVRGAYMEKERRRALELYYESPIHNTKDETDADYDKAIELCLQNINTISLCLGTHNEQSSNYVVCKMKDFHLNKNESRICFSQLYGMSDHISFNLADAGFNVAKYVPYGPIKEVVPYLIRRAEENTSVKGQTSRELSLILKEQRRRERL